MSALDLSRDQQVQAEIYDAIQRVLDDYNLLVTPTLACLPVDNAHDGNTVGPQPYQRRGGGPADRLVPHLLRELSGHPAASIPAGLAEGQLPVGMQLIGRRYGDADVLAASATFERIRPWQGTYQLCADRTL
jgi:amidase